MNHQQCEHLEAFLAGALDAEAQEAFARHVEACAECEHQIRIQRRIDEVLDSAIDTNDALPAGLMERIERELLLRKSASIEITTRRTPVRLALAAALGLAVIGWIAALVISSRSGPTPTNIAGRPQPDKPEADSTPQDAPASPYVARIAFTEEHPAIAVPMESTDPDITIVWVYPVAPRKSLDAADDLDTDPTSSIKLDQHPTRSEA